MGNEQERPLERAFYLRDANTVAPELLGKRLIHVSSEGVASGMIVEVEAYIGSFDKGAHSYPNKRTRRTEIQFGPGGYAYVYSIYGKHLCFNVVTNVSEKPEAILIRALEPVDGIWLMRQRRHAEHLSDLCGGPGKLCEALGITKRDYGCDLCGQELYIAPFRTVEKGQIMVSPRINIEYAGECKEYLWRYFIKDSPYVSRVGKRYRCQQKSYEGG